MLLTVSHEFLPKANSVRASQVMDFFGIGWEQGRHVIAEGLELPIRDGDVVLFTGASGSGKSSLMRAAAKVLGREPVGASAADAGEDGSNQRPAVVSLDELVLPDRLLIDALDLPVERAMNLLSACGLGEAHLMLRLPSELSDGQRYRFRLALALAQNPRWVLADEFTATLDRTLARVIAFNLRRLADRSGAGFLLATTHEDVAADLAPDLHVQCSLDGDVTLTPPWHATAGRDAANATSKTGRSKKNGGSHSTPTSGSPPRPSATGRTSLGGITVATRSGS